MGGLQLGLNMAADAAAAAEYGALWAYWDSRTLAPSTDTYLEEQTGTFDGIGDDWDLLYGPFGGDINYAQGFADDTDQGPSGTLTPFTWSDFLPVAPVDWQPKFIIAWEDHSAYGVGSFTVSAPQVGGSGIYSKFQGYMRLNNNGFNVWYMRYEHRLNGGFVQKDLYIDSGQLTAPSGIGIMAVDPVNGNRGIWENGVAMPIDPASAVWSAGDSTDWAAAANDSEFNDLGDSQMLAELYSNENGQSVPLPDYEQWDTSAMALGHGWVDDPVGETEYWADFFGVTLP